MRKRAQTQPTRLHRPARANAGLRAAVGLAFCVALFYAPVLAATGTADATRLTLPDDLPRHASAEGAPDRDEARLEGRLLINPDDPSVVGVLFDLDPGWHLYWRNPGDSGLATKIEFRVGPETAPTQVSDELIWPTPHSFGEDDGGGDPLITYGYGDRVLLSAQLPAPLSAGEELGAEVRALVCERQCIPASLSLSRKVPKTRSPENAARARGLFAHFERQIPRPPKALGARVRILWGQSALRPGDTVAGGIALTSCSEAKCVPLELATEAVSFFPEESESLTIEVLGRSALDLDPANTEVLTLRASIETDPPSRLRGVLITYDGEGHRRGLAVDLALRAPPRTARSRASRFPGRTGSVPRPRRATTPRARSDSWPCWGSPSRAD